MDTTETEENRQELQLLKQEQLALQQLLASMDADDFSQRVFTKVFNDDVVRICGRIGNHHDLCSWL
jgi:hypothetical protein